MLRTPPLRSERKSVSSESRLSTHSRASGSSSGSASGGRSSRTSTSQQQLAALDKARVIASSGRGGTGNIKNAKTHETSSSAQLDQIQQVAGVEVVTETTGPNTNSGRGGSGNIRSKTKLPADSRTATIISEYQKSSLDYEKQLMADSASKRRQAAVGRGGAGAKHKKAKPKAIDFASSNPKQSMQLAKSGATSAPAHAGPSNAPKTTEGDRERSTSFSQVVKDKFRLRKKKQLVPTTPTDTVMFSTIIDISIPFPEDPNSPASAATAPETPLPSMRFRTDSESTRTGSSRNTRRSQSLPSISHTLGVAHPGVRSRSRHAFDDTASIAESTWSFHAPPPLIGSWSDITSDSMSNRDNYFFAQRSSRELYSWRSHTPNRLEDFSPHSIVANVNLSREESPASARSAATFGVHVSQSVAPKPSVQSLSDSQRSTLVPSTHLDMTAGHKANKYSTASSLSSFTNPSRVVSSYMSPDTDGEHDQDLDADRRSYSSFAFGYDDDVEEEDDEEEVSDDGTSICHTASAFMQAARITPQPSLAQLNTQYQARRVMTRPSQHSDSISISSTIGASDDGEEEDELVDPFIPYYRLSGLPSPPLSPPTPQGRPILPRLVVPSIPTASRTPPVREPVAEPHPEREPLSQLAQQMGRFPSPPNTLPPTSGGLSIPPRSRVPVG